MSETSSQRCAIGLLYEADKAPEVVSKGFGELAEQIVASAKEKGILVHQDEQLVETLSKLNLHDEIPRELYYVIAELIAFSYVLQGKFPPGWQGLKGKLDVRV
ncbi:FlhB domain protein [Pseudoalteromonas luteoviolacea B = ATCC 29581]|nr:FlhB domain protein [Pseudoalteromonas luteoviolacea B = ATCC 29581]